MGAICYLDPHRCGNQEFNENYKLQKPSDIYSLGVIFWQIFGGRPPFKEETRCMELFEQISHGRREIAVHDTPKSFIQLYETCWHSDPKTRPTIGEVVKRCKEIVENPVGNGIYSGLCSSCSNIIVSILIIYFAILDIELISDQCRRQFSERYPANCLPSDHVLFGDIAGVRAHFDNAENVDIQFNNDER